MRSWDTLEVLRVFRCDCHLWTVTMIPRWHPAHSWKEWTFLNSHTRLWADGNRSSNDSCLDRPRNPQLTNRSKTSDWPTWSARVTFSGSTLTSPRGDKRDLQLFLLSNPNTPSGKCGTHEHLLWGKCDIRERPLWGKCGIRERPLWGKCGIRGRLLSGKRGAPIRECLLWEKFGMEVTVSDPLYSTSISSSSRTEQQMQINDQNNLKISSNKSPGHERILGFLLVRIWIAGEILAVPSEQSTRKDEEESGRCC